jgi:hypothetical protein
LRYSLRTLWKSPLYAHCRRGSRSRNRGQYCNFLGGERGAVTTTTLPVTGETGVDLGDESGQ